MIVYKIVNLINNRFYIGVHNNTNKNYLGSGRLIKEAIKKYGRENFRRETLFESDSEDECYLKEFELVEPIYINSLSYNIEPGGRGNSNIGKRTKELKVGIHSLTFEERSINSKKVQANRNKDELFKTRSKAGKAGGKLIFNNKLGIHGYSQEQRSNNAKETREKLRELGIGWFNHETASNSGKVGGKLGGPKNKGFKWYTDGITDFKYTQKEQNNLSFNDFIFQTNYKCGRSKTSNNKELTIKGVLSSPR